MELGDESYDSGSPVKQLSRHEGQEAALIDVVSLPPVDGAGLMVKSKCSLVWFGAESDLVDDLGKPLGRSHAGIIEETHLSLRGWMPGERVSGTGHGATNSSRTVFIPADLAMKIPSNVSFEEAVFSAPGGLAMRAVVLASVVTGQTIAVIDLGLTGRLVCKLLAAMECRVLGLDSHMSGSGADGVPGIDRTYQIGQDSVSRILDVTSGRGVDAVIITTGAESSGLKEIAGLICKRNGTVVAVGSAGQGPPDGIYSERELTFRVTGSYRPRDNDPEPGILLEDWECASARTVEDYRRKTFLELISSGRIEVASLITHRFDIARPGEEDEIIPRLKKEESLGVLFNYERSMIRAKPKLTLPKWSPTKSGRDRKITMGLIGEYDIEKESLAQKLTADEARRSGFELVGTNAEKLLSDPAIDSVYIANVHNRHLEWVVKSLLSGKATFVDNCLCLKKEELEQIEEAHLSTGAPLMVGYRRRFAPLSGKIREILKNRCYPLSLHYRINPGSVATLGSGLGPSDDCRSVMDDMCDYVDLLSFLVGGGPTRVCSEALSMSDGRYRCAENLQIMIRFSDGSVGTISYVASGDPLVRSEYLEILGNGAVIRMDDFRSLVVACDGKLETNENAIKDTGKKRMLQLWHYYLTTGLGSPISFEDLKNTSLAGIRIRESLSEGNPARMTD